MSSTYRVSAGNVPVRVASDKPVPPEDPIVPAPSGCRNLTALAKALVAQHGSHKAVAGLCGFDPRVVSQMMNARPQNDRAFTIARKHVEAVARFLGGGVTVEDVLAGRALARVQGGAA